MKLLPSLKQKKRYLVFEIVAEKKFSFPEIRDEIESALQNFFGQMGLAKASPLILKEKFNPEKQRFILKINHKWVDELKSALILSKSIKNTPIIIKSVIVSGSIKKADEKSKN